MSKGRRPPRIFWWVKYRIADKFGKWGAFDSESKAIEWAQECLHGATYEAVPLDTRNPVSAAKKLRSVILRETKDVGISMQRIRSQAPTDEALNQNKEVHFGNW